MSTHRSSEPMLARTHDPPGSSGRRGAGGPLREKDPLIPPDAQPAEILERIRDLITDHSQTARRMAVEAAARFPENAEIQNAKRILNDGRATAGSGGSEPSSAKEFEWLRYPAESARGKWIALVGSKVVGSADTLRELTASLRAEKLSKPALVHRID